jgi:hypothetical protein
MRCIASHHRYRRRFRFRHNFAAKSAVPTAPAPAPIVAATIGQRDVPIYLTGVGTVIAINAVTKTEGFLLPAHRIARI